MSNDDTQRVDVTVNDGGLGTAFPTGRSVAIMGQASSGALNTPALFSQITDLVTAHGQGPGLELAAMIIAQGVPVKFTRTTNGTAGANSAVDATLVTGTATPTLTGTPRDYYQAIVEILVGGTVGTAGIVIRYSLDGGWTYSRGIALGTADTYAIPDTGVTVDFEDTETYVAGDSFSWTSTEPKTDTAEWGLAFDAIKAQGDRFRLLTPADTAADQTAVEAFATELVQLNTELQRKSRGIISARDQNNGESLATWRASLDTEFSDYQSAETRTAVSAGYVRLTSPVTGRKHRRPASWLAAARQAVQGDGESLAKVDNGALPFDATLKDLSGNIVEHDSRLYAGLSSKLGGGGRFVCLKTYDNRLGTYFDFPSLMHAPGSDFTRLHLGIVADVACELAQDTLTRFLGDDLALTSAGTLAAAEANMIKQDFVRRADEELIRKGLASAYVFDLNLTTVLSGGANLPVTLKIVPRYYAEVIDVSFSFSRSV